MEFSVKTGGGDCVICLAKSSCWKSVKGSSHIKENEIKGEQCAFMMFYEASYKCHYDPPRTRKKPFSPPPPAAADFPTRKINATPTNHLHPPPITSGHKSTTFSLQPFRYFNKVLRKFRPSLHYRAPTIVAFKFPNRQILISSFRPAETLVN